MTEEAKKLGNKRVGIYDDNPAYISQGITLREYYVGLFMQGILCNSKELNELRDYALNHKPFNPSQTIAKNSVYYADALLEELSKE
jgi:hypothetical protein